LSFKFDLYVVEVIFALLHGGFALLVMGLFVTTDQIVLKVQKRQRKSQSRLMWCNSIF